MKKILAATALSLALLSGTALAQVSVDTGLGASVGVGTGGDSGTNAGVNAGGNAGVSTNNGKTNAGADIKLGANANTDTDAVDADATLKADADAKAKTDDVDTNATASVGADAKINAVLDGFGDEGDAFFADEEKSQPKSDTEVQEAFAALSAEQQAELRTSCSDAADSAICSAIAGL